MATACSRSVTLTPVTGSSPSTLRGYAAVEASYGHWQRLRVPVTISTSVPKPTKISGVATMVRDSSINISLRMLGFEVAVIDVTPDSIVVADKMNRQYVAIPIASAVGRYGITAANLQDLLTGRVFLLGADFLTPAMESDFRAVTDTGARQWILNPRRQPSGATYAFAINHDNTLSAITITPDGGEPVGIPFNNPVSTSAGTFASLAIVTIPVSGSQRTALIEWNWDRASFDGDVAPKPFSLSHKYRKLELDQLLKQLPSSVK